MNIPTDLLDLIVAAFTPPTGILTSAVIAGLISAAVSRRTTRDTITTNSTRPTASTDAKHAPKDAPAPKNPTKPPSPGSTTSSPPSTPWATSTHSGGIVYPVDTGTRNAYIAAYLIQFRHELTTAREHIGNLVDQHATIRRRLLLVAPDDILNELPTSWKLGEITTKLMWLDNRLAQWIDDRQLPLAERSIDDDSIADGIEDARLVLTSHFTDTREEPRHRAELNLRRDNLAHLMRADLGVDTLHHERNLD